MGILDAPGLAPIRLAQRLVSVGSSARYPGAGLTSDGTVTGENNRIRQSSVIPVNGLVARYGNLRQTESDDANPSTITVRAAVEWYSISQGVGGFVFWPIFFGGKRTVTLEPGAIVDSDPMGIVLPTGALWYLRTYLTLPSGGTYFRGMLARPSRTDGYQASTTETDMTTSGSFATLGGDTFAYGPLGLFTPRRDRTPCIALIGDSIINGSGDTPTAENGFAQRAINGTKPVVPVCAAGYHASLFTYYNAQRRLTIMRECTSALMLLGTNDLGDGINLATMQSRLLGAWAIVAGLGIPLYGCTIIPRTASTDSWATTSNQTGASSESVRVAFNTWLRAGAPIDPSTKAAVAIGTSGALTCDVYDSTKTKVLSGTGGHYLTGIFETADTCETSRNSGIWKVNGSANYGTADGVHPSTALHTAMAAAIDVSKLT